MGTVAALLCCQRAVDAQRPRPHSASDSPFRLDSAFWAMLWGPPQLVCVPWAALAVELAGPWPDPQLDATP